MIVMLSCIASSFIFSLPPIHLRLFHAGISVTQEVSAMLVSSLQVTFFSLVHLLLSILQIQHLIAYLYLFSHMLAGRPGSHSIVQDAVCQILRSKRTSFIYLYLHWDNQSPNRLGIKQRQNTVPVALSVHPPTQAETHIAQHTRKWISRNFL